MGIELKEEQTIYEVAVRKYLDCFKEHNIRATFFIVGRDLEDPRNRPIIERLIEEGHEIANHGYSHRTDMKRMPLDEALREIDRFSEVLDSQFGLTPKGFKSPAYGIRPEVLKHLNDHGYLYDSSVFPTVFSPVVKAFQNHVLRYKKGVAEFGDLKAARASLLPYHPSAGDLYTPGDYNILELPVSSTPIIRAPFHFSFVNVGGRGIFEIGWLLNALARPKYLNYAFHGIDILDESQSPKEVHGRPGLAKSHAAKMSSMNMILKRIAKRYQILPTIDLVEKYA